MGALEVQGGLLISLKLTSKLFSRVNISAAPQDRVHSETSTKVIGKSNDCATKKALLKICQKPFYADSIRNTFARALTLYSVPSGKGTRASMFVFRKAGLRFFFSSLISLCYPAGEIITAETHMTMYTEIIDCSQ